MQKVELFKPEDFDQDYGHSGRCYIEYAAKMANEKLQKYLESCPVAYFKYLGGKPFNLGPELNEKDDTHTARLAFIEELPKEPCKHTVASHRAGNGPWTFCTEIDGSFICGKCGAKLEVEWKEVK